MLLRFLQNVEILWNSYQHRLIVELFPGKVLFFFLKLGCCFECLNSCKHGGGDTSLQMEPMFDSMLNLKTLSYMYCWFFFARSLNIEFPSNLCIANSEGGAAINSVLFKEDVLVQLHKWFGYSFRLSNCEVREGYFSGYARQADVQATCFLSIFLFAERTGN